MRWFVIKHNYIAIVTLTPGEECEGNAFGSVSVCKSVRMRNSKTIAPIVLIFYTRLSPRIR